MQQVSKYTEVRNVGCNLSDLPFKSVYQKMEKSQFKMATILILHGKINRTSVSEPHTSDVNAAFPLYCYY